ncbi:type IV toxin-antitoxin system AbiEi family antitoxin domain-containing protein [Bacteroides ihuae]|uniref:type IV toxin-antitoxin system AbiEi family antitoxin domain-containing protein n=1 Tax=Bacteroides ihuae TaxID=1852362 RepID=UPI0008DA6EA6|nr:hypothetical protein [Bacteroides ihuae]
MDIAKQFGIIPVNYGTLTASLSDYKSPKDRIEYLEATGIIMRIKKGLYVCSPKATGMPLSLELIANHLYNPSYISYESALSFYGIIPERAYTIKSAVMKRSKTYTTSLGHFEYIQTDTSYFSIGVRSEVVRNAYAYMIATPEKALCDMILSAKGLRLQSRRTMQIYLEEDLRCDFSLIEKMNLKIIKQCAELSHKKNKELNLLYDLLK